MPNLIFNLMVHEFEALLFSGPDAFSLITTDENVDIIKGGKAQRRLLSILIIQR